jgi:fructose-1,6-bisphosphatase/inositol monophosphatase family enzyme
MNNQYDKELEFAKKLALAANEISDQYYRKVVDFKTKSDTTPVTIADEEINKLVIDEVKRVYPNFGVLGEEETWQLEKDSLWVCDPIDGTIAFSMGDPVFTFSLALVVKGKPVVAVARELALGRTYWACLGGGAYLGNLPIHVSKRDLSEAWLAYPTELKRLYGYRSLYEPLANAAYQVNTVHGAVFKSLLVAQGLVDATVCPFPVHPWDFAAVKLIVEEAGGQVTTAGGSDQRYDKEMDSIVLSNSVIHQDILKFIKRANLS